MNVETLRSVPLFEGLSDETLQRILDQGNEFEAVAGHVLVAPNQPGMGLFVVEEGTVTVDIRGREIELGPGEFFGELSLLDEGAVRHARVCAATDVRCLAIHRDDFTELIETEPQIARSMLRVLARRLGGEIGR
ncbi:MAG: cyclic nucleotide-binding domain-containing protein [Actinomycetota bacterium]|nr:cyclic nucleotide-binding domain-containing protein [Actinomycetota bacterium]